MTQLYTASFRAFKPAMGKPVITSLGLPRWLPESAEWDRAWLVTPQGSYFGAEADVFEKEYLAQLDRHGPEKVARVLHRIAAGADVVLLCHEHRAEDCHRSILAGWYLARLGEEVRELI